MRLISVVSFLALTIACSAEPSQPVDGIWRAAMTIPGVTRTMTLTQQGSDITGSGTWTGEAINPPGGALTVVGTADAGQVILTFRYDNGRTSTFTGTVSGRRLAGQEEAGGNRGNVVFNRQ